MSTLPIREVTVATSPAARPRASASAGCMSIVQRCGPLTKRRELWSHELLVRGSRRPMRRRMPAADASTVAAHCTACDSRCRSATSGAGARSMRRPGVFRRCGKQGSSGPRSKPCGCAAIFERVRPRENGFQPAPRLPRRMPSATLRFGVSQRDISRAAQPALRIGSCAPMRSTKRSKISQSCSAPGGLANNGFEYFTVLRTANTWKMRSKWSRSRPEVGGRM